MDGRIRGTSVVDSQQLAVSDAEEVFWTCLTLSLQHSEHPSGQGGGTLGREDNRSAQGCGFTMCQIIVVYYCSSAVLSLNACHTIVVYYTLSKQGILSILTALACGGYGWGRAIQSSDPPPSSVQQPPSSAFRLHLLRFSAAGRLLRVRLPCPFTSSVKVHRAAPSASPARLPRTSSPSTVTVSSVVCEGPALPFAFFLAFSYGSVSLFIHFLWLLSSSPDLLRLLVCFSAHQCPVKFFFFSLFLFFLSLFLGPCF